MLYRRMKRRRLHLNYYSRPVPRLQRIFIVVCVLFLLLAAVISISLIQLRPVMLELASAEVNKIVMNDINDVIREEIISGALDYGNLVKQEKDQYGNITALETNMQLINQLQSSISKSVVNRVNPEMIADLRIPIGNAIGGALFSGRGPAFGVKILSVASVKTKFSDSFEDAGINQTRHKITLQVTADIELFVPGTHSASTVVETDVVVCDIIIVGKVPNMYADIGNIGGAS